MKYIFRPSWKTKDKKEKLFSIYEYLKFKDSLFQLPVRTGAIIITDLAVGINISGETLVAICHERWIEERVGAFSD